MSLKPFDDPDPFHEINFPNRLEAKVAISDKLGIPLSRLDNEILEKIDATLLQTLEKEKVFSSLERIIGKTEKIKNVE